MSRLNDLGAVAIAARTQDIDLARRQALKLAARVPFLETVQATLLDFFPVPGEELGGVKPVPELAWHAQSVPFFDYLLQAPRAGAVLAGGHPRRTIAGRPSITSSEDGCQPAPG